MNPWIRLYRESIHNPKIVVLNDRQHRAWHNCLLVSDDAGVLPKMRDIACHMRMTLQEAEQIVCELVEVGLVDIEGMGADRKFKMHDWNVHQYVSDNSTERVKKFRSKNKETKPETAAKRFSNAGATPPDTDTDTDTEVDTPLPPTGAAKVEKALPKFGKLEALEAFHAYNAVALKCAIPQAAKLTPNRERSIVARLKDYGLDGWHRAIANIEKSKFLTGGTEAGFRADLDFVCQAKSFGKLHDGGYSNGRPVQKAPAAKPVSTFAHPPKEREEDWQEEIARQWMREQQNQGAVQ